MADPRAPRGLASRDLSTRAVYKPPSVLPDPTPDPGWVYRWVATHVIGQSLPMNTSQRFREGWVPVKAADHPELQLMCNTSGNVEIGGLMLCKMQAEVAEARKQYYEQQTANQMTSVDQNFMRENDPRMPLFSEKRTEVSFGRRA